MFRKIQCTYQWAQCYWKLTSIVAMYFLLSSVHSSSSFYRVKILTHFETWLWSVQPSFNGLQQTWNWPSNTGIFRASWCGTTSKIQASRNTALGGGEGGVLWIFHKNHYYLITNELLEIHCSTAQLSYFTKMLRKI